MKKVAVVGASGFVGKAIVRQSKNYKDLSIVEVTRENFEDCKKETYDVVINTAMPSKRYWALNNPVEDILETVVKTSKIFYEWKYDKFVQISTVSAETQLDIPYGSHKKVAEEIVRNLDPNALIVRLGSLYGEGLSKSALYDIANKKHFYVDIDSEYDYVDVDFVGKWILENLSSKGIKKIGAKDTISLREVCKKFWSSPTFEGRLEKICFQKPEKGMPSSREVIKFLERITGEKDEKTFQRMSL